MSNKTKAELQQELQELAAAHKDCPTALVPAKVEEFVRAIDAAEALRPRFAHGPLSAAVTSVGALRIIDDVPGLIYPDSVSIPAASVPAFVAWCRGLCESLPAAPPVFVPAAPPARDNLDLWGGFVLGAAASGLLAVVICYVRSCL